MDDRDIQVEADEARKAEAYRKWIKEQKAINDADPWVKKQDAINESFWLDKMALGTNNN